MCGQCFRATTVRCLIFKLLARSIVQPLLQPLLLQRLRALRGPRPSGPFIVIRFSTRFRCV